MVSSPFELALRDRKSSVPYTLSILSTQPASCAFLAAVLDGFDIASAVKWLLRPRSCSLLLLLCLGLLAGRLLSLKPSECCCPCAHCCCICSASCASSCERARVHMFAATADASARARALWPPPSSLSSSPPCAWTSCAPATRSQGGLAACLLSHTFLRRYIFVDSCNISLYA